MFTIAHSREPAARTSSDPRVEAIKQRTSEAVGAALADGFKDMGRDWKKQARDTLRSPVTRSGESVLPKPSARQCKKAIKRVASGVPRLARSECKAFADLATAPVALAIAVVVAIRG